MPRREPPNHQTPSGLQVPGSKRLTRPQAVRVRHLTCTTAALEFSDGFMKPMPRVDHYRNPSRGHSAWWTHSVQWLRGFYTCDIPHIHRLPLVVLPLHGRSFGNEAQAPCACQRKRKLSHLGGPLPSDDAFRHQASPKSPWTGLQPSAASLGLPQPEHRSAPTEVGLDREVKA